MSWSQLCGDFNDNNSPKLQQVEDYGNCSLSNNDEEIILKELDLNKLDDHSSGVELQITNLDRSIPPEQMRKILILQFREFVTVKELNISFLSDGKPQAIVKLENQQSAQLAIFRLHRKKLGHKRIYLAYRTKISLSSLKSKVASVLLSIPGGRIHLMKFRELYDKRFNSSIRITDLHQMKDLLYIIEDISGKIIQFNPNITAVDKLKGLESFYCCKHSPAKNLGDDDVSSKPLFYLNISLKDVSCDINLLLKEHDGRIPLSSLSDCYQHMFPEREQEGDQAVPLLHLITCIKGVKVIKDESAMKSLVEISVQALTPAVNVEEVYSQQLANQFSLLSRELVDLLKTWPGCRMPFNKFIPAFHHYFGRQCRVADYGFTKLRDLFEAMPHVVHVLGEGSKAVITLSKKAQIRRFTSDIQKILKLEPEKHVLLSDLPMKFVTVYSRPFKISDYGVCNVSDMLEMLPEKTFKISFIRENKLKGILQIGAEEENMIIALPRREQPMQFDRTLQFSKEVVHLLKHTQNYTIYLNKFIPAFHYHFGVQCRVSEYGFLKLIDLFQAIPRIVDLSEDSDGEKVVQLTQDERLKVLGEQLHILLEKSEEGALDVAQIRPDFLNVFGYQLRVDMFKSETINQLIDLLPDWVCIETVAGEERLVMSEQGLVQNLGRKILELCPEQTEEWIDISTMQDLIFKRSRMKVDISQYQDKLLDKLEFKENKLRRNHQHCVIKNIEVLLQDGRLNIAQIEAEYESKYCRKINYKDFGFLDLLSFLLSISSLSIRGSENRLSVGLQEYKDLPQISKKCRVKHCDLQVPRRLAMKPPCPTAGFMPPTPPFSWIKGEVRFNKTEVPPPTRFPYFSGNIPTLQAQYFRNCPTPPVFGVGLSTPPPLHPCTPPPPPVTWSQSVTSDQMGYQTIWGRVSASSRYQRGWVSGFNTTPVHGSPRWLDRQTTGEFNPGFKQCGDGAYPIRNSIFGIKVDQDELEYNKYGDPFVNQGFVLMTPPGSSSDYPQYQVSPLARPYGFSSQQYQQFTSFPGTFEPRGYYLTQESLFSQSFSVPPVPSPTSSRKFTFPVSPLSPTTARSPLSPGLSTAGSPLSPGLSTGLYHIPPINTNSPESAGQKRVSVGSTFFPSYFSQGK